MSTRDLNSWIEISESAYAANLRFFRRLVGPDVELSTVVKANAYGHGLEQVADLAVCHGADSFCVHSLEEALRLRQHGWTGDVLILGPVPFAALEGVVDEDFRLVVFHRETVERLAEVSERLDRPARLHLELETGTHRLGLAPDGLEGLLDLLQRCPRLQVDGVYTHFANIEDTTDHSYARSQLAVFEQAVERLRAAGVGDFRRHTACSAATLVFPETHFEMVRLGVGQYGFWPSKETLLSYGMQHPREETSGLRPVLTWKTRISQLQRVPAGSYVGYGCSYQTTRESRLAVLPIGYSDGYDRGLSNRSHVLVRGRRAPVRGRVCMNLTIVDVTDIPGVEVEDEVVLIGRQAWGDVDVQEVRADDLAAMIDTIHYEVVARLAEATPRIVVA